MRTETGVRPRARSVSSYCLYALSASGICSKSSSGIVGKTKQKERDKVRDFGSKNWQDCIFLLDFESENRQ